MAITATEPNIREALDGLDRLVASIGGEPRAAQELLLAEVVDAIAGRHHLIAEAGTGIGKTFAYLTPAVLSGKRVLVSTAGKRLGRQLVDKDLPMLRDALRPDLTFSLAKGRSNYACQLRVSQPQQETFGGAAVGDEVAMLRRWAATTDTGDRFDVPRAVSDRAWSTVSVGPGACPGASSCSFGQTCFTERARAGMHTADVVVTNHHLLAYHLRYGDVLPEVDVIIVDEAHELVDAVTAAWTVRVSPGRVRGVARAAAQFSTPSRVEALTAAAAALEATLPDDRDVLPLHDEHDERRAVILERLESVAAAAADVGGSLGTDGTAEELQSARRQLLSLAEDASTLRDGDDRQVRWADGRAVQGAPLDVSRALAGTLLADVPVLMVSATLRVGGMFDVARHELGLEIAFDENDWTVEELEAESPFPYERSVRYVATDLPHPTKQRKEFDAAAVDRAAALIEASRGRAMLLTSTSRARDQYAAALRQRLDVPLLVQGELPDGQLVARFAAEPETCLVGTIGLWQGVDVPGDSLQLVIIDRVPFAPPDDPLSAARQDVAGGGFAGFMRVSVPAAATLMAQGAGRLVRGMDDRGVVAVLDPRVASDKGWTQVIARSMPPMTVTDDLDRTRVFLRRLDLAARARAAEARRAAVDTVPDDHAPPA